MNTERRPEALTVVPELAERPVAHVRSIPEATSEVDRAGVRLELEQALGPCRLH